jgi:tetratricopeptide (TPR) repeat protein
MKPIRILVLMMLPLCLWSPWAGAQEGGDLQAQILYAYYIEDSNELASLVQLLHTQEQVNGADDTLRYHLAHAEYRLGLLYAKRRAAGADPAFAGCINELKPLLDKTPGNVEALTLQSACYANLARQRKVEAVLLDERADERISRAVELASRNPRVELVRAQETLSRSKPGSADSLRALGQLELSAQVFEQSTTTSVDSPGWGQAEAYLELGRQLQLGGDVPGARNWIEKSLLIAPDYRSAQRQLASLAQR